MIFRKTIKPRDKEDGGKMNDYLQNLHVSIDLPHLRLQMIAMLQEKQQEINQIVNTSLENCLKNFDFNMHIEKNFNAILERALKRALENHCNNFFSFGPGKDVFDEVFSQAFKKMER